MSDGDRFTSWLPTTKELLVGCLWYTLAILMVGAGLGVLVYKICQAIF